MTEIDWIETYIAPLVHAPGAEGLRDDVALLSSSGSTIATMDTLVEGVHFLGTDPLDTVGLKLIRVNVSDVVAKGALPSEALLSIAWPKGRGEEDFKSLMAGLQRDLETFEIALIGGDLVATDGTLTLTIAMTGACIENCLVRRSGGKPGQALWISGEIGWGGIGLEAAESGRDANAANRYRIPQILGLEVAEIVAKYAAASMDVSDGLFLDASRLAEASVEVDALPAPTLTVGASYEYYLPSFDGDSIFNWFAQFPTHDAAIRSSWEINRRLLAATRTGVRRFGGRDENGRDKFDMAPLFEVTTRLQQAHGTARIRVSGFSGALRQQMGAGLSADRSIWDETASVLARFSAFRTQDELSRHPDWNSYSYMLGVEARALPETSLRLEFDHAINPLVGHRFRVVALLDLAVVR